MRIVSIIVLLLISFLPLIFSRQIYEKTKDDNDNGTAE